MCLGVVSQLHDLLLQGLPWQKMEVHLCWLAADGCCLADSIKGTCTGVRFSVSVPMVDALGSMDSLNTCGLLTLTDVNAYDCGPAGSVACATPEEALPLLAGAACQEAAQLSRQHSSQHTTQQLSRLSAATHLVQSRHHGLA